MGKGGPVFFKSLVRGGLDPFFDRGKVDETFFDPLSRGLVKVIP